MSIVWNLTLVNKQHPVDKDYVASLTLTEFGNGMAIDARCYSDLQDLLSAGNEAGFLPHVVSAYRTNFTQYCYFWKSVIKRQKTGMSVEHAQEATRKSIAEPGTSEHELGLAVDLRDLGGNADEFYAWLAQNAYRFGFILRYPNGRERITGILYEPWHYRFVGHEAAAYIYEHDLTLEELLDENNHLGNIGFVSA